MHSTVHTCHTSCGPKRRGFSIFALIGLARSRRELAQLSNTQLRDIGITPEAAYREAQRPIWDVPSHWMK